MQSSETKWTQLCLKAIGTLGGLNHHALINSVEIIFTSVRNSSLGHFRCVIRDVLTGGIHDVVSVIFGAFVVVVVGGGGGGGGGGAAAVAIPSGQLWGPSGIRICTERQKETERQTDRRKDRQRQ